MEARKMNEPSKMTALPYVTVRERLLSKRQDGIVPPSGPSNASSGTNSGPKPVQPASPANEGWKTCAREACKKPFKPRRPNQDHCSPECRKKKYFETHFVRVTPSKPTPPAPEEPTS